mgnify:CR=1 FL=1
MRSQSLRIFLTDFNTNYIIIYLMPSRADGSFLQDIYNAEVCTDLLCQCPLGLMTHFYKDILVSKSLDAKIVSMPSRADDSFLLNRTLIEDNVLYAVSMPSRADDSFLRLDAELKELGKTVTVSMPSRADDSFLPRIKTG